MLKLGQQILPLHPTIVRRDKDHPPIITHEASLLKSGLGQSVLGQGPCGSPKLLCGPRSPSRSLLPTLPTRVHAGWLSGCS